MFGAAPGASGEGYEAPTIGISGERAGIATVEPHDAQAVAGSPDLVDDDRPIRRVTAEHGLTGRGVDDDHFACREIE